MGCATLSSVCSLAPPSLPSNRDRDLENRSSSVYSSQEQRQSSLRSAFVGQPRKWSDTTTSDALHLERSLNSETPSLNRRSDSNTGHGSASSDGRVCGCWDDSLASGRASTSQGCSYLVNAEVPMSKKRMFGILKQARLTSKKCSKGLMDCDVFSKGSRRVTFPLFAQRFLMNNRHVKQPCSSEKDRKSAAIDELDNRKSISHTIEGLNGAQPEGRRLLNWKKRKFTFAAAAAAGLLSLSLSFPASAEPVRLDFSAPVNILEVLDVQLHEHIRMELDGEIQVQRKEWGITNCSASAPPLGIQNLRTSAATPIDSAVPEVVASLEEDGFEAWKQVEAEIESEGEKKAVPVTRPVHKTIVKKEVEKTVAASVAVAVAGSVAGAASAAGRAVATSGSSAVATSLTVLHSGGVYSGSSLLARAVQHLGGGGVAGAVGATVVYPLDTIKTRMQAQSLEGETPQYKDEIDCFKQLVANEGPASLYSGLLPQLLGIAPEKAMKLTVNELLLEVLETMMPGARIWALEFIAGGGGGFSQVVFTNPMEIVKVRLQTQSKSGAPKNTWDVVKELGVGGLYNGAGMTLARDVPSSAIFFACYAVLQQLYPDQSFLAGCLAAIPATIFGTPMDIIKTRLQKELAPGEVPYRDWLHCLQQLIEKEGPQALFKGSLLRVLRTSPQFGITLMIYGLLCNGSSALSTFQH